MNGRYLIAFKTVILKSLRGCYAHEKKWALFSLLTLCGGTIYKLPSLKDAFYIPMQEYFHLTNGQIGNAMSVNSFVTTVGFFCLFILPINYRADTPCHSHSLRQDYWVFI